MEDKDFLEELLNESKPDSFKEEERVKIEKERKPLNTKLLAILLVVLLVLAALLYFLFFAPKIEMPSFVGEDRSKVTAFIKQYEIKTSGVVFEDQYSFEYDEGQVIYQSIEPGVKIKPDAKMNFIISLGADPDEHVDFMDNIYDATKPEIERWIKENKLTKTKITTTYSDVIPEGYVISYSLKNVEEDDFTRSTVLNISISKGPAPVNKVIVSNLIEKPLSEAEQFAYNKKITLVTYEIYDNKVAEGLIIRTIPGKDQEMKEGDVLTVYVSKGKGIVVPDFLSMTRQEFKDWELTTTDPINVKTKEVYSSKDKYVLSQSIPAGWVIGSDKAVIIEINKGKPNIKDFDVEIIGNTTKNLNNYLVQTFGDYDLFSGTWDQKAIYSDTYEKGKIVSYYCVIHGSEKEIDCNQDLPEHTRFMCTVSAGRIYTFENDELSSANALATALTSKGVSFTSEVSDLSEATRLKVDGYKSFEMDFSSPESSITIYEGSEVKFIK